MDFSRSGLIAFVDMGITFSVLLMEDSGFVCIWVSSSARLESLLTEFKSVDVLSPFFEGHLLLVGRPSVLGHATVGWSWSVDRP